jgi:hypothetical protein
MRGWAPVSKPSISQAIQLIRMAALTLKAYSIDLSIYPDEAKAALSSDQMLELHKTLGGQVVARPYEPDPRHTIISLEVDGIIYWASCWTTDLHLYGLHLYGLQPPTTTETDEGGAQNG